MRSLLSGSLALTGRNDQMESVVWVSQCGFLPAVGGDFAGAIPSMMARFLPIGDCGIAELRR
ncbi:hypothetical protein [Rhodococcus qingshengii]|uniref:hypothetical protein n=1 Tax=Rhodococcus qingshengii TaxID=334542 RepID=UPI0027A3FF1F|nr:hypothetical protein PI247_30075 [Rhodococcus qingshengii]